MDNYKLRQIMSAKKTPKTEEDKAGMNDLLIRIKDVRTQAVKGQPENPQKELDLNG